MQPSTLDKSNISFGVTNTLKKSLILWESKCVKDTEYKYMYSLKDFLEKQNNLYVLNKTFTKCWHEGFEHTLVQHLIFL